MYYKNYRIIFLAKQHINLNIYLKNGLKLLICYHTIFLLPLLINTLINKKDFGEIFTNNRVIKTNLNSKKDSKDIEDIKEWVLKQKPTKQHNYVIKIIIFLKDSFRDRIDEFYYYKKIYKMLFLD